ncbi:hypothetical protein ABW19_dt0207101 [Dactylella cylindrospora]|nr:hypothetical protein ABW19_dt0207101 [Dactylella cylindrospora]
MYFQRQLPPSMLRTPLPPRLAEASPANRNKKRSKRIAKISPIHVLFFSFTALVHSERERNLKLRNLKWIEARQMRRVHSFCALRLFFPSLTSFIIFFFCFLFSSL